MNPDRTAGRDLALAAVVLLSRLPFLGRGYGTDNDAWSVVAAARHIAATGEYKVSRFPGFPLHEYGVALLQAGGPWAVNGASAVACAVAAVLLARLLRRAGVRDAGAGALAFAFVPAVFVASTAGMDYLGACALVLLAFELALEARGLGAGIALGLATACRITSIAYLPPIALLAWARRPGTPGTATAPRRTRAVLAIAVPAVLVGALAYLPVLARYGMESLSYYEPAGGQRQSMWHFLAGLATLYRLPHPPAFVAGIASVGVFGLPGFAALAVVLVARWARRTAPARPPAPAPPRMIAACGAAIAIGLALFLRLPDDEGYLIPVLPFAFVLLGRALDPRAFRALCVALMLSPFVLGVDAEPPKKGVTPESRSALARRFALGHQSFVLDPLRGPLLMDQDKRRAQRDLLARARERWAGLPANAVVIAGLLDLPLHIEIGYGPVSTFDIVTLDDLRRLRAAGRPIYYLPDAPERTRRFFGYALEAEGARPLL